RGSKRLPTARNDCPQLETAARSSNTTARGSKRLPAARTRLPAAFQPLVDKVRERPRDHVPMNRPCKIGPRVLRTRSPARWAGGPRRCGKVQTPPDPAELLRVGTTRGPFMVLTHVHPQVFPTHEPDRQGRTAGPPDPQSRPLGGRPR